MKIVLFQSSNTQRVTADIKGNEVLLTKEWRKSSNEIEWNTGKGITLPRNSLITLGELLSCKSSSELKSLLSQNNIEEEI